MKIKQLTEVEQRRAAKEFAEIWKGEGYEKGQSQKFWTQLLRMVYGVENSEQYIAFEEKVELMMSEYGFMDGYIDHTKVLIEQKSGKVNLDQSIPQSNSNRFLSPFEQAQKYSAGLPYSKRPRWIVISNFKEFRIYDMELPKGDPISIKLEELPEKFYLMDFLVDPNNGILKREMEISLQAGDIVGRLYDELLKQYNDPTDPENLKSLNILCVRLIFLLYAEDANLLQSRSAFHDFLNDHKSKSSDVRSDLIKLFQILDTKDEDRDEYEDDRFTDFPYINGGLFANKKIKIPKFNETILNLLIDHASSDFKWSIISPTIFGAIFESTLNPETRRSGGMHYTSIENIHKVIDPLFLDDLKEELNKILYDKRKNVRRKKLEEFQNKLASLTFLDPAAGSGNFLTETYISLRKLENNVLRHITGDAREYMYDGLEAKNPIKVSIENFNGIEINDFAVTVARTALWIAESQMLKETETILESKIKYFPLRTQANIVEGNALRLDWNKVIDKNKLNYIMGNPPFVGTKLMNPAQKDDATLVLCDWNRFGILDYVACWYKKASDFIHRTNIICALVSTNSICQGEQVSALWQPLFESDIEIKFAYQTFVWDSEASSKANVHCVIVGFGNKDTIFSKRIFGNNLVQTVNNISPYLTATNTSFIRSRRLPICSSPQMYLGCDYKDNDIYIFSEEEKDEFLKREPQAKKYIRPYMTGVDFIQRKPRYCLWFQDYKPEELKQCPLTMDRVAKVKEFRENSDSPDTRRYAEYPLRPARLRYYSVRRDTNSLALPRISSQTREYVPIDIFDKNTIGGASILMIPDANFYTFGVLTSVVHMAWMRSVCGRLKSDYSYSNGLVYNNFPWVSPTKEQIKKIEKTAKAIFDARDLYPNSTLADLYDPMTMPPELKKAHKANDKAVMEAYGFDPKQANNDSYIVEGLFKLYQQLTNE